MKFPATFSTDVMPALFGRFLQIIGSDPWEKRHRVLSDEIRLKPLSRNLIMRRHVVELTIGRLLETHNAGALSSFDITEPSDYAALGFVATVALIYEGLTSIGKTRVAGILRDALNTERGLRPFQNEVQTATHLMHAGFDVTFTDLEGQPGFDFLATRDGVEIEVECKSVSGDLGRQVHDHQMVALSQRILHDLEEVVGGLTGGRLIRVTLPARLLPDHGVLQQIASNAKAAFLGMEPPAPEVCETTQQTFDLIDSPFADEPADLTQEKIHRFIEERFGFSNVNAFVLFQPAKLALLVVVDSQKRDRVVNELIRTLKDASEDQFSHQRPAILAVQFLELEADALLALARHDSSDPQKRRRSRLRPIYSSKVLSERISTRSCIAHRVYSVPPHCRAFKSRAQPTSSPIRFTHRKMTHGIAHLQRRESRSRVSLAVQRSPQSVFDNTTIKGGSVSLITTTAPKR